MANAVKHSNIQQLNSLGQSIWYDNLSREVLQSGLLSRLIARGVSGLTSNPTIFKGAIADSSNYDNDLKRLGGEGKDATSACEALMLDDVARAADLLRPIYDSTEGRDGYASIEVSPFLAHSTEQTIQAAESIWKALSRPNVMIKVPATEEGIPAIEHLLASGINVNITLIFSVEVYRKVVDAYLRALKRRSERNDPLTHVASVASFFVSRVDAIFEKQIDSLADNNGSTRDALNQLIGKVALANSHRAYQLFLECFNSDSFKALSEKGAQYQRPLWASTGTKNPDFNKTLYVEELVGPHTVNTVPPTTLDVILEKEITFTDKLSEQTFPAEEILRSAAEHGFVLEEALVELQRAGVESFSDSYQTLLDAVAEKLQSLSECA